MTELTRSQREAERLLVAIRALGIPVPNGTCFKQTYASRSQRVEGGSVWVLIDGDGRPLAPLVCSQGPRRILLRGPIGAWRDRFGEYHIDPDPDGVKP